MKRRLEESAKVEGGSTQPLHTQRPSQTGSNIVQTTFTSQSIKTVPSEVGTLHHIPIQTTYTMPSITTAIKVASGGATTPPAVGGGPPPGGFQRLKVEDALSYLDQVKYKFSNQPQVYNDFLDIMKEFKSQCIDTPGVITRVSKLFTGYPELIIGFNTFLPPGYKIEVQANDTGYSLQVSVSMASPPGTTTHHSLADMPPLIPSTHHPPINVVTNQTNKQSTTVFTSPISNSVLRNESSASTGGVKHGSGGGETRGLVVQQAGGAAAGAATTAVSAPVSSPPTQPPPQATPPQIAQSNHQTNQPVEFNHAINYVNKIKNRFQGQPEKYKRFLEILHTYQKEQRIAKNGGGLATGEKNQLTEAEVYSQVAKLFENQEDLLTEFGQFLPDATNHNSLVYLRNKGGSSMSLIEASNKVSSEGRKVSNKHSSSGGGGGGGGLAGSGYNNKSSPPTSGGAGGGAATKGAGPPPQSTKRSVQDLYSSSPTPTSHHPVKRHKSHSHTPTLLNFAGFDNIKKSVRSPSVYDNLLRVIYLYNCNLIGRSELMVLVGSVLGKHPDLVTWVRDLLVNELRIPASSLSPTPEQQSNGCPPASQPPPPPPPPTNAQQLRLPQEHQRSNPTDHPTNQFSDLDLTTCKRIGTSYCALPKNYVYPKCSGRTSLCKQVLNDSWVSIPAWSEEATFVTSKKTQYEEYIYRCEDERFELDVVIECNASTIRVLEGLQKKMSRMSSEELSRFKLDDSLGGTSPTTYIRAIRKLYGEKAQDIVEGLKKNPAVAVPIVLKRLKAKELEWRQAQKGFNKIWREQNEKYYLKSLDHQGINFKPNDLKALRSKTLYNEIEAACDASGEERTGPHMVLPYTERGVLDDAADLLIYHVKRQTTIHKHDKQRIKQLLRQFLPDLFHHPRQDLSDDEKDQEEKIDLEHLTKELNGPVVDTMSGIKDEDIKPDPDEITEEDKLHTISSYPDEAYNLFFGNNNWYLFMRLHHILCERLSKMSEKSQKIAEEEALNSQNRKESTAVALRLKPNEHVTDCYGAMLDMVKSVLDCSLDPTTYEDNLRNMFGIHAYIGFTLDRVVTNAVRQLQLLVTEESCIMCWEMHTREKIKGGAGGFCKTYPRRAVDEAAYQRTAISALPGDNCYKMYIYKRDCKLTIELLESEVDDEDEEEENLAKSQEKWSSYTENLTNPAQKLDPGIKCDHRDKLGKIVYLPRNLRRWSEKLTKTKSDNNSNATNSVDGQKIESCDETQCRILSNNKMMFVVNKDSCLYKKEALVKAKESHERISKYLYERFVKWHEGWADRNITLEQREEARTWLLGMRSDAVPNVTVVATDNRLDKPPYRLFNRYRVSSAPSSPQDDSVSSSSD